jgi:uncharacterized iron-regulated membrane protein
MNDLVHAFTTHVGAFLHRGGVLWGVAISLFLTVASVGVAVAVVVQWPANRFSDSHAPAQRPMPSRVLHAIARNVGGAILIILGIAMSLPGIPGQGFLTIIIGITLLDIPGKRRLERRLIARPRFLHIINRMRVRFRRPPLELE